MKVEGYFGVAFSISASCPRDVKLLGQGGAFEQVRTAMEGLVHLKLVNLDDNSVLDPVQIVCILQDFGQVS